MPEPSNAERAAAATAALEHYAKLKGEPDEPGEAILVDFLVDLLHAMRIGDWDDFDDELEEYLDRARRLFEMECPANNNDACRFTNPQP